MNVEQQITLRQELKQLRIDLVRGELLGCLERAGRFGVAVFLSPGANTSRKAVKVRPNMLVFRESQL